MLFMDFVFWILLVFDVMSANSFFNMVLNYTCHLYVYFWLRFLFYLEAIDVVFGATTSVVAHMSCSTSSTEMNQITKFYVSCI